MNTDQSLQDNYELIRRAILDRRQVQATYGGRSREMCPHALGLKNGRRQALVFQFGGESSGGLRSGGDWRCLPVDRLSNISLYEGDWHTDERYSRARQTCVDSLDVAVAA